MILNPSNWSDPTCHYRFNLLERRSLSDAGILFSIIIFYNTVLALFPKRYSMLSWKIITALIPAVRKSIWDVLLQILQIKMVSLKSKPKDLDRCERNSPSFWNIIRFGLSILWCWSSGLSGLTLKPVKLFHAANLPKRQPPMTCFGSCTAFWTFCGRKNFHSPFPFWKVKNTVCWMDTTRTPKKAPLAPRWCPPLFWVKSC